MKAAKSATALARDQRARARRAVRSGRAASVSAYIARALDRQSSEESLEALVRGLIAEYGEPTAKDRAWARKALKRRKRG
jgi:hypothetical protein